MQVTFELPIPDGYELAEPLPRVPDDDDVWCMNLGGTAHTGNTIYAAWILRKKWVWPEWLKDGELEWSRFHALWMFRTPSGLLWFINSDFVNFTPPTDKTKVYKSSDYRTERKP